eukprot:TRINITY_DN14640_c0_g1_i1.p2 TRINITY_DN14640_c0_g1~~TRINITY_DN14640_c0_g1_i1.p2  ORF type:complete len:58 (-),score=1.97 TRINITY_DN14640_c0_g1_i1:76-249(-)
MAEEKSCPREVVDNLLCYTLQFPANCISILATTLSIDWLKTLPVIAKRYVGVWPMLE